MNEIEVKILNVDRMSLVNKLINLGAKKIMDAELLALLFNHPLLKLDRSKEILRLRREGDIVTFTHKSKLKSVGVKKAIEDEVIVSDFEVMKEILLKLKFEIEAITTKRRISYKIGGVKFEFDKYLGDYNFIPEFLEIEAPSEKEIYEYIDLLGFSKDNIFPHGFTKLVEHYS